ncbi:hypothetical protein LXA43DRAFT_1135917 [Ganoderma leucocontextum]|nr:hypothetical protein LXA43DRAFT_1135917 [Ganoderma leucocontextum]
MGTRFHQLDLNAFNEWIPGESPTPADRARFLKPVVDKREMSGCSIGAELARTIRSVLDAGGVAHRLEVLYTPCQRDHGDHTEGADNSRSELRIETRANQGISSHGLWLGPSVIGEVKGLDNEVCAFYMDPGSQPHAQIEPVQSKALSMDSPAPFPAVDLEGSNTEDDAANGGAYINHTYEGEVGLDRLSESMLEVLTEQHRLFAYSFYVKWKWVRMLYVDRAGVLVSELFDWTETTSLLHDFVWKVGHLTPEQLGYDPTALVASGSDVEKLRSKMEDASLPAEVQQYVRNAFLCKDMQPPETTATNPGGSTTGETERLLGDRDFAIYRLTVPSSDPPPDEVFTDAPPPQRGPSTSPSPSRAKPVERAFLVGCPHVVVESRIGRMRGYIAFDLQEESFCFLKDSWRPLVPGQTRPEHWVYERLRQHNVPGIATLVCGGDVGGPGAQITAVQDLMPPDKQRVPHVHYRIVIKEIGVPLTEFMSFTELASNVAQALDTHCAAWEKASLLHCNVDVESILINPKTREGMLVDWEVSRVASELEDGSMKPDPTRTWRSRSALSLFYPRKPYRLSDDIEAFVHVFRYLVLRFHRTWLAGLREYVHGHFEQSAKVGSFSVGGRQKMDSLQTEKPPYSLVGNPDLQELLDRIAYLCHHEFYKLVDTDVMEDKYGVLKRTLGHPIRRRKHNDELHVNEASEACYARMMASYVPAPIALPPPPAFAKVDACDIQTGFLTRHAPLMSLFWNFRSGRNDKHEDQFDARAAEEPTRAIPPSQDCMRDLADRAQVAIVTELPAVVDVPVSPRRAPPPPNEDSCVDPPTPSVPPAVAVAASASSSSPTASPSEPNLGKRKPPGEEDVQVAKDPGASDRYRRDERPSPSPKPMAKRCKKGQW